MDGVAKEGIIGAIFVLPAFSPYGVHAGKHMLRHVLPRHGAGLVFASIKAAGLHAGKGAAMNGIEEGFQGGLAELGAS